MKVVYDPALYHYSTESLDSDHVIATYYFAQEAIDHLELVGFMALESSTGGWIDFPGETPEVRRNLAAKVISYFPVPAHEAYSSTKAAIVQLAYPMKGTAGWNSNIPMLLTAVAGNILEMPGEVKLLDLTLPKSFVDAMPGPQFGVDGVRQLVNAPGRPLVTMMIKPKIGLSMDVMKQMAYEAGLGGVDHIKDDEMMAQVYNCSLTERIKAVMSGLRRAEQETGNKTLYTVNISGTGADLLSRAEQAVEAGANAVMINYSQGFEALRQVAESPNVPLPILFHPAGSSANKAVSRMVLAKLARVCGADFYLTGSPWAKWARNEELESTIRSAQLLHVPMYGKAESFVVQSAVAGKVPVMMNDFGCDVVLGGGAAIHGHPKGITAGARAIHQAIDAALKKVSLEEYAQEHVELADALALSPGYSRPKQTRY